MIVTLKVPDLWVSEIAEESVAYTYVSDDDFINELNKNGYVQVGYYKLSALETQKVDLTDYVKNTDYATKNKVGLVKPGYCMSVGANGDMSVQFATKDLILQRHNYGILGTKNIDDLIITAITGAKLPIGQTDTSLLTLGNQKPLSEEEKTAAKNWLGVQEISITDDGNGNVTIANVTSFENAEGGAY